MQNLLATSGLLRSEPGQSLQNGHFRRQLHVPPHGVKIEPGIDERAIEVKNNSLNHASIMLASRAKQQPLLPPNRSLASLRNPKNRKLLRLRAVMIHASSNRLLTF